MKFNPIQCAWKLGGGGGERGEDSESTRPQIVFFINSVRDT